MGYLQALSEGLLFQGIRNPRKKEHLWPDLQGPNRKLCVKVEEIKRQSWEIKGQKTVWKQRPTRVSFLRRELPMQKSFSIVFFILPGSLTIPEVCLNVHDVAAMLFTEDAASIAYLLQ